MPIELIHAVSKLALVVIFYPIVFLVFKRLRQETLSNAGHFFGIFGTWVLVSVPGFLLGEGFYDWHPFVILITPTIAATLGVAIALSLFGETEVRAPKGNTKKKQRQSNQCDEELFALAWDEVQNKEVKKGLWAKAFADAGGDSERTKSIYLDLRVKQLIVEGDSSEER